MTEPFKQRYKIKSSHITIDEKIAYDLEWYQSEQISEFTIDQIITCKTHSKFSRNSILCGMNGVVKQILMKSFKCFADLENIYTQEFMQD